MTDPTVLILTYVNLVAGPVSVISILLVVASLFRTGEIAKARFFLRFDRLHRMHKAVIMVIAIGVLLHLVYLATGMSTLFEPEMFMPFGAGVLAFHIGAIIIALAVLQILGVKESKR